jgi:pimeloyl-ACP methyl ester carboxylesterase
MREIKVSLDGRNYQYFLLGRGKKTLVMLHGLAADKGHMARLLKICPDEPLFKKYRCLIPDLFGHNCLPAYEPGTVDDHADYIIRLIKHLKIRDFALIGFSFGSLVSLKIAEHYRKKIALVLWASPIAGASLIVRLGLRIIDLMPAWLYKAIVNTPLAIPVGKFLSQQNAGMVVESAKRFDKRVIRPTYLCADKQSLKSSNPKLFIFGTKDPLIPMSAAHRLLELGPNNARIMTVRQAGHAATDEGTKAALGIIRAFLYENF